MVGHLQTNKVKQAVKIFDLIHSVDSTRLAQEIDKQAAKIGKTQEILIEVKTSTEATKFGFLPDETADAVKEISRLKNIKLQGLMTIAPLVTNPEEARPCFRTLRELRDEISKLGIWNLEFGILSMGMSDDFEVAIEEGTTMVRIGRAVFEG
ncbi:MAG: YggS family pyridoxal phosphate-dependent enzyme [Candidatus Omnitrophota bacterium]